MHLKADGDWSVPLSSSSSSSSSSSAPLYAAMCLSSSAVGGPSSYLEPVRTKGLSHFHSAHMPVSPGGGQQQENRGELEGRQISNSKLGLLAVFFFFSPSFSDKVKYDLQRKREIAFDKSTDNTCYSCNTRTLQPAISHTHSIGLLGFDEDLKTRNSVSQV